MILILRRPPICAAGAGIERQVRGRSPKAPGEVVHTEGHFRANAMGTKYSKGFVNEASRAKHVVEHNTRDAATGITGAYIDE